MHSFLKMKKLCAVSIVFTLFFGVKLMAQSMPSADENIPYLVTFSKNAEKTYGDDEFVHIYFFSVPTSRKEPVYIRIYDPDVGGKVDEQRGPFDSKTKFSVYGGKGAHSNPDARTQSPTGNYKSGILLASKIFGNEPQYDGKWYTFGPFNPEEGELQPNYGGYVFKLIVEGLKGDDGNLYRLNLSSSKTQNIDVEGSNSFTYEYCFRTHAHVGTVCHIYPFVGPNVVAVKVHVFDYDKEGIIRIVSVAKRGEITKGSGDGDWIVSTHKIVKAEVNTSLDIQFVKTKDVKHNNIVVYITNQYGKLMPFYTAPIGGAPKFKYRIGVQSIDK